MFRRSSAESDMDQVLGGGRRLVAGESLSGSIVQADDREIAAGLRTAVEPTDQLLVELSAQLDRPPPSRSVGPVLPLGVEVERVDVLGTEPEQPAELALHPLILPVLRQHGGPGSGPRGLVGLDGGLEGRVELARAQEIMRGPKQAIRARQELFDRLTVV